MTEGGVPEDGQQERPPLPIFGAPQLDEPVEPEEPTAASPFVDDLTIVEPVEPLIFEPLVELEPLDLLMPEWSLTPALPETAPDATPQAAPDLPPPAQPGPASPSAPSPAPARSAPLPAPAPTPLAASAVPAPPVRPTPRASESPSLRPPSSDSLVPPSAPSLLPPATSSLLPPSVAPAQPATDFAPPVPAVATSFEPPARPPEQSDSFDPPLAPGIAEEAARDPDVEQTDVDDVPTAIDELLDADGSVVVVLDRDGTVRTVNHVARRVLGAASTDQMQTGSAAYSMLRSLLDHVPRHLLDSTDYGTWHGDFDHTDPVGRAQVFRATVAVRPEGDDSGYVAIIAHDVTGARAETEKLRHRATHDALTGLANRRQVLSVLEHAVALQRGRPGHVATLFIDLDRLKYVNDALGHAVGDRLLISTAERLAETVRPDDHVARIGGDEFLVACTEMPDADTALELAERIRKALSGRLRVRGLDLEFSVSIGIALSDPETLSLSDGSAASALISNADTAMYEAKRIGRGRSVAFTSKMRKAARDRTELATALTRAVDQNELTLEYQPVFSAVTRRATATEALVGWNHPERGWIDPKTFVAVAEESGSIGRLGEFVLQTCLGDLRQWIDEGLVGDTFAVHVKVSQVQLASASFVHQVQSILKALELAPARLVLEARESALVSGNADIQRSVRTLRRIGVGIAVDNFGTGANALSVLTDVGADFLKLDGSLALPSGSSDADIRLVRALVLLAHALDIEVVADKVSGANQLKHLQAAGCDYVQGHLLGTPLPSDGHHPAPLWPLS